MAETSRYIDVIVSARVSRKVETYRAKIELTVTTRKRQSCLDHSLALREQVIAALQEAGIRSENIEEGGGQVTQSSWSSSKRVVHELRVSHPEMSVLIGAMAKIERVFAAVRQPLFSGVKTDFTFSVPTPEFAEDDQAGEEAMKGAIANARSKATILANEAGLVLDTVVSITEVPTLPRRHRGLPESSSVCHFGDADYLMDFSATAGSDGYTPGVPIQGIGHAYFRVRFAVKDHT